ncbi:MAG: NUDIX domain-containing protein [Acidobacteria bacterium]|nr:NUDIX domain-containing protein [Acidobacteriota bacterium]MBI3264822.1 NUDIX domain-containing protein [Acidobacteriota bacterium]
MRARKLSNRRRATTKQAAGALVFRNRGQDLEVLLIHPSGPYNRKSPWSIPKGEPEEGEDLEAAARRETREETGVEAGALSSLGYVDYAKSRKRVHGFAAPAPDGVAPWCASWEVDRAEFVSLELARTLIHPDQAPFLERLVQMLEAPPAE